MTKRIPQLVIDELLQKCDIVQLISEYLPLKKKGTVYLACCPFHQEKTPSFNVIPKKQFYHCFGCKANGNAISFVMAHLTYDFVTAVNFIATKLGYVLPKTDESSLDNNFNGLLQALEQANNLYQNSLKLENNLGIKYLKSRGIDGHIAKKFQLGFAQNSWDFLAKKLQLSTANLLTTGMLIKKHQHSPPYDRYRNRIIFPIHNIRGQVVGFGGRAILPDQTPKYLNSPETPLFQKKRELYGLFQVITEQKKPEYIIIVEGYLDVIALAQHGINNSVAVLGTALTHYHIQILHKYTNNLYLCFDGDSAGQAANEKALKLFIESAPETLNIFFVSLPHEQDPDSFIRKFGPEKWHENIAHSLNLEQYCVNIITQDLNSNDLHSRQQIILKAKVFLKDAPRSIKKALIIEELAKIVNIETLRLEQLIDQESQPLQNQTIDTTPNNKSQQLTTAEKILFILIQNPKLADKNAENINLFLNTLKYFKKDHPLHKIYEIISKNNNLSTGQIIEHFRQTEIYQSLAKFISCEYIIERESVEKEWYDLLIFIQKQRIEKKIQKYIEKSKNEGLTLNEKTELQKLLKTKISNNFSET